MRNGSPALGLVLQLGSTDEDAHREAVEGLVALDPECALPVLEQALADADARIREGARAALARIPHERAATILSNWIVEHRDERAIPALAAARTRLGRTGLVDLDPLLAELRDPDYQRRARAARAAGLLRCHQAVPTLVLCLQDPVAQVREEVAGALASLGDPAGAEGLIEVLTDETCWSDETCATWMYGDVPRAFGAAMNALGALGDMRALDVLCRLDPQVVPDDCQGAVHGENALAELALRLGPAAFPRIAAELASRRSRGRLEPWLVSALAATGDPRAEPVLLELFADETTRALRPQVMKGLALVGGPGVLSTLLDLLPSGSGTLDDPVLSSLESSLPPAPTAPDPQLAEWLDRGLPRMLERLAACVPEPELRRIAALEPVDGLPQHPEDPPPRLRFERARSLATAELRRRAGG